MKNLRMSDCNKWPERDSGKGSVSNPSSVHSQQHSVASGGSGRHHHHRHSVHHQRQHSQPKNLQSGVPLVPAATINGNHRAPSNSATLQTTGAAVIIVAHQHISSSASGGSQNHQVIMAVHQDHDASGGEQQQLQLSQKLQYRNILSIRIQYSITKMLLLISSVFILLNLPSYVIRLQVFVSDVMATGGTETSPTAWLLQQFFMLLYYTNFSINFLLYSTCGATFRHCLCRLLRDKVDTLRRIWLRLQSCPRLPALFVAPTTVPSPLQEQELQQNLCPQAEPEIRQQ